MFEARKRQFQQRFSIPIDKEPGFAVSACRNGLPNLSYERDGKTHYIHASFDPVSEQARWLGVHDLEQVEVLYIYGMGLGYAYDALSSWLHGNKSRRLVFLEPLQGVFHYFLHETRAGTMLDDFQVAIIPLPDNAKLPQFVLSLCHLYVGLKPQLLFSPHYEKEYFGACKQFKDLFVQYQDAISNVAYEAEGFGLGYYGNFYNNVFCWPQSYYGPAMQGAFAGKCAIICGAGPSLAKNGAFLKEMQDRAIILAGGSALNSLSQMGVKPHFGATVDPNPVQVERMLTQSNYFVPLFYKTRVASGVCDVVSSPLIYLPHASSYPICDWLEQQVGLKTSMQLSEGFNVINLLTDLARRLGCTTLLFVGLDLAFTDNKLYGTDVEQVAGKLAEGRVAATDIFGKPTETLPKWQLESRFLSEFAREYKQLRIVNCTEGGIGAEGVVNLPLREACALYANQHMDSKKCIEAALAQAKMPATVTHERIKSCLEMLLAELRSFKKTQRAGVAIDLIIKPLMRYKERYWTRLKEEGKDSKALEKQAYEKAVETHIELLEMVLKQARTFTPHTSCKVEPDKIRFFYADGKLARELCEKGGLRLGEERFFYPSGALKIQLTYEAGKLRTRTDYSPSGARLHHTQYLADGTRRTEVTGAASG